MKTFNEFLNNLPPIIKNPKKTIQKKIDKFLFKSTQDSKLGPINYGGSSSHTGSVGAPEAGSYKDK
tara:strand:- start:347 stop:544 length:198 start_codon:yes stop_codon:yes gene_type:complete